MNTTQTTHMPPETNPQEPEAETPPKRDALTIGRFLLLTAGVAIGLGVFWPGEEKGNVVELDRALGLYNALLVGLALPAPLFVIGQRIRKGPPVGPGGLFSLTVGLGVLLMLPPVLVQRIAAQPGVPLLCLYYVLPLVSAWYLIASLIAGKLGRSLFARSTPWTERHGFLLALLWTPMGIWWLIQFYWEAFR